MIGRRPTTSLRRPQRGLANTQIVAETAKIVAIWNGETPSDRAAGGRTAKSSDCPTPMQTRDATSTRSEERGTGCV